MKIDSDNSHQGRLHTQTTLKMVGSFFSKYFHYNFSYSCESCPQNYVPLSGDNESLKNHDN